MFHLSKFYFIIGSKAEEGDDILYSGWKYEVIAFYEKNLTASITIGNIKTLQFSDNIAIYLSHNTIQRGDLLNFHKERYNVV
jgi:hypothetical protein